MKKILTIILVIISWFISNYSISATFPYQQENSNTMKDILEKSNMDDISETFLWEATHNNYPITYYVAKVINYFLIITWFIAVVVLFYWFSLVFTQWRSDESMKKAYQFIKMTIISIIIIWISYLFSSWVMSIYNHDVVGNSTNSWEI